MRRRLTYSSMTPESEFRPRPSVTLGLRIAIAAALVALIAGALALGTFILGLALTLVPIALIAIVIAYAAFRIELWRSRRRSGQRNVFPP